MTGKANEALHIMGSWWWPKLEIRTGEQRSLTYEVRTQKKDAWFNQSAMDVGFCWLEKDLTGFHVYLFSGDWF